MTVAGKKSRSSDTVAELLQTDRLYVRRPQPKHDDVALGGEWLTIDPEAAGDYLVNLTSELDFMKQELELGIGALLTAGWSWEKVGHVLGLTRQGAQQKYPRARADFALYVKSAGEEGAKQVEQLRRRMGIRRGRIQFEVRDQTGEVLSVHVKPENAMRESSRLEKRYGEDGLACSVWKVYPDGAERLLAGSQPTVDTQAPPPPDEGLFSPLA